MKKIPKLRKYFMALLGRRRVPIRIAQAEVLTCIQNCREWWMVEAHSAKDARALCRKWPSIASDPTTHARITNHGRAQR